MHSQSYPITLAPNTVAEFAANGFVTTPNMLNDDELSTYANAVDAEVAARTASDTRSVREKTTYEQSFVQCMRLWETDSVVRKLSCHPALAAAAAQLLDVASVRLWQDQALYKEAGGRETTAHQDETFWPIGSAPLVSAWIPFDAINQHNGAMAYVPGSHHVGNLRPVDITHQSKPYDILGDPKLNKAQPQWVNVQPGAVVWHHGLTVHQAAANNSTQTRRVFTVVYVASDAQRVKSWPCFPLDREQIEVGQMLRGPGLPVIWPQPDTLPIPPTNIGEKSGPQQRAQF